MKKIIIYTVLGLLVIVLGVVIINWVANPLQKSDEQIRASILELTPIGMSKDDVVKVIEKNEQWYKNYKYLEQSGKYEHFHRGYLIRNDILEMYYDGFSYNENDIIGKETIKATVGQYRNFFNVAVFAYWAFDEDGKLVDVGVKKDADTW